MLFTGAILEAGKAIRKKLNQKKDIKRIERIKEQGIKGALISEKGISEFQRQTALVGILRLEYEYLLKTQTDPKLITEKNIEIINLMSNNIQENKETLQKTKATQFDIQQLNLLLQKTIHETAKSLEGAVKEVKQLDVFKDRLAKEQALVLGRIIQGNDEFQADVNSELESSNQRTKKDLESKEEKLNGFKEKIESLEASNERMNWELEAKEERLRQLNQLLNATTLKDLASLSPLKAQIKNHNDHIYHSSFGYRIKWLFFGK